MLFKRIKNIVVAIGLIFPFFIGAVTSTINVGLTINPTSTGGGGITPTPSLEITNVAVSVSYTTSSITWQTNNSATCNTKWATTTGVWINTIVEGIDLSLHRADLTGLSTSTVYLYEINCSDTSGGTATYNSSFTTNNYIDTTPPPNISGFNVICGITQCSLDWSDITNPDIARLRIYRSTTFYPQSPSEGTLVYNADGRPSDYNDTGLSPETRYFYTAFSFDTANNISSGAVDDDTTGSLIEEDDETPIIDNPIDQGGGGGSDYGMDPGQEEKKKTFLDELLKDVDPEQREKLEKIEIKDFDFNQDQDNPDAPAKIDDDGKLNISIGEEDVPDFVKAVLVKFERDGKEFTFLLKKGIKGKLESDIIVPFDKGGKYDVTIFLVDYDNNIVKKLKGDLQILNKGFFQVNESKNFLDKILNFIRLLFSYSFSWLLLLGALIAIGLGFLFFNKKESLLMSEEAMGSGEAFSYNNILWGGLTACNVCNLSAQIENNQVVLSWINTPEVMGERIKIFRHESLINSAVAGLGTIVYECKIENEQGKCFDSIAKENKKYYYSAFVYDDKSTHSSGTVAWINPILSQPFDPLINVPSLSQSDSLVFNDFIFYQQNQNLLANGVLKAKPSRALEVLISDKMVSAQVAMIILEVSFNGIIWNIFVSNHIENVIQGSISIPQNETGEIEITSRLVDRQNNILIEKKGVVVVN